MMQLSFADVTAAYLAAAGLIATLVLLARWNRKQGWRRRRGAWLDVQAEAALRTVEARSDSAPLQHLDDLGRLHQALVAHGVPQAPVPKVLAPQEKPLESNVLA
jgi:hypothetical protein